jgi:hypothetical protein
MATCQKRPLGLILGYGSFWKEQFQLVLSSKPEALIGASAAQPYCLEIVAGVVIREDREGVT